VSRYQKGKTNLDLLQQEIVSGSGINWAICKPAWQITKPASHHSVFYRPDALPATQPTALKEQTTTKNEHKKLKPGSVTFYDLRAPGWKTE